MGRANTRPVTFARFATCVSGMEVTISNTTFLASRTETEPCSRGHSQSCHPAFRTRLSMRTFLSRSRKLLPTFSSIRTMRSERCAIAMFAHELLDGVHWHSQAVLPAIRAKKRGINILSEAACGAGAISSNGSLDREEAPRRSAGATSCS